MTSAVQHEGATWWHHLIKRGSRCPSQDGQHLTAYGLAQKCGSAESCGQAGTRSCHMYIWVTVGSTMHQGGCQTLPTGQRWTATATATKNRLGCPSRHGEDIAQREGRSDTEHPAPLCQNSETELKKHARQAEGAMPWMCKPAETKSGQPHSVIAGGAQKVESMSRGHG